MPNVKMATASSTSNNPQEITSSAHHDLLIQEIESVDDYLGPTFRAIYDGDPKQFMEHLENNIKNHDKDIERMCNFHYQGFIDSIRELQQVKAQAMHLKSEVVDLNDALQSSASNVLNKGEDLVEARRVEKNIQVSIEKLTQCLPVFSTYAKLQKQMKDKRYYPALKTLEQLEQVHLPRVSNYRFFQQMKDNIPKLRENIKVASMSDLKDFLENIRKFSSRIGEVAMKHTAEQLTSDATMIGKKTKKKRPAPAPPNPFTEKDCTDATLLLHIKDLIMLFITTLRNYGYSVTQLFDLLHEIGDHYNEVLMQRWVQVFRELLEQESFIPIQVETQEEYDDIVETFGQVASTLDEEDDPSAQHLIDFSPVYRCLHIYTVLGAQDEFQSYYRKQRQEQARLVLQPPPNMDCLKIGEEFKKVGIQPAFYNDKTTGKFLINNKPRSDIDKKSGIYSIKCADCDAEELTSQSEVDDMMRKSTNLLLTRTFSGCLSSLFHKPSLALNQIIQIIIDTRYLEDATVYLEQFVSNITGSMVEGQLGSRGEGHLFRVARDDAERQICEKLKNKLDSFLELENYDWLLVEPQGHASSFITDLIAFLQSIFQSFTNIPSSVAKEVCKSACEHIAKSLLGFMLSEDVKQISMGALQQINLDTIQCEQFAASDPVPGLEDGVLLHYFAHLRQVLDLLMAWDWPTYFHDYGQEDTKYQYVNPNTAIILLEKLREADKKSVFSALKKSERDKKKLLETVLKQLRQLAVTAATAGN
ncbi:exocyst complex component 6 [Diaphorina citri]|uniref:Exocyst complex component n=1 Tax=Diaphorina citri TaxID=121845 RepID=A0A3Q0J5J2_DIACI|nr:exocyst complex component 6 [Diaphorina citri]